jgi:hypothetical protein
MSGENLKTQKVKNGNKSQIVFETLARSAKAGSAGQEKKPVDDNKPVKFPDELNLL